jgi:hypothetical protein
MSPSFNKSLANHMLLQTKRVYFSTSLLEYHYRENYFTFRILAANDLEFCNTLQHYFANNALLKFSEVMKPQSPLPFCGAHFSPIHPMDLYIILPMSSPEFLHH